MIGMLHIGQTAVSTEGQEYFYCACAKGKDKEA